MSGNDQAAAVAALFAAGIILLNLGVATIQEGDLYGGLTMVLFGLALIFAAVLIQSFLMQRIARKVFRNP